MKKLTLWGSTALSAVMAVTPALAQMTEVGEGEGVKFVAELLGVDEDAFVNIHPRGPLGREFKPST